MYCLMQKHTPSMFLTDFHTRKYTGGIISWVGIFLTVTLVSEPVRREAEYLICDDDLLVGPPLFLDLRIDVKQLIQCKKEHLWVVAISHYVFVT